MLQDHYCQSVWRDRGCVTFESMISNLTATSQLVRLIVRLRMPDHKPAKRGNE
jgi:hypothetical protein